MVGLALSNLLLRPAYSGAMHASLSELVRESKTVEYRFPAAHLCEIIFTAFSWSTSNHIQARILIDESKQHLITEADWREIDELGRGDHSPRWETKITEFTTIDNILFPSASEVYLHRDSGSELRSSFTLESWTNDPHKVAEFIKPSLPNGIVIRCSDREIQRGGNLVDTIAETYQQLTSDRKVIRTFDSKHEYLDAIQNERGSAESLLVEDSKINLSTDSTGGRDLESDANWFAGKEFIALALLLVGVGVLFIKR